MQLAFFPSMSFPPAFRAAVARGDCRLGGLCGSQGWISEDARRRYHQEHGKPYVTPRPEGSVPLKLALIEVAEATGLSPKTMFSHWNKLYHLPLVIVRRTRTHSDVDPASIPAAVEHLKSLRLGKPRPWNAKKENQ